MSSRKLEIPSEYFMQRWAEERAEMVWTYQKEKILSRWQEYTEEFYKKDLNDPENHDGVITHLEPDILEYEVKWDLGSITANKASGGDGIPAELFQVLKDDTVIVLYSICQKIWKTQQWTCCKNPTVETKHHTWRVGELRFIKPAVPDELML